MNFSMIRRSESCRQRWQHTTFSFHPELKKKKKGVCYEKQENNFISLILPPLRTALLTHICFWMCERTDERGCQGRPRQSSQVKAERHTSARYPSGYSPLTRCVHGPPAARADRSTATRSCLATHVRSRNYFSEFGYLFVVIY